MKDTKRVGYHYFATNVQAWATGETRESAVTALIKRSGKGRATPMRLWYVPMPEKCNYSIDNYAPVVKGAIDVTNLIKRTPR